MHLHVIFQKSPSTEIHEFSELARACGVHVSRIITARRDSPDSRYFIGEGKAMELATIVRDSGIGLVLCSQDLSPVQQRNLEKLLCVRVIDRTALILDIFAQRARSFEGKLQVELAQLSHLSSRLVRGWTHLERQKGGIGLRGPGETQLETDRRLIGARIKQIKLRLDKVKKRRYQSTQSRKKAMLSTVAIVGYTNAGKSTLFNEMTGGSVYCEDQLFATLDTTVGSLAVNGENPILLTDTVGFVRDLPPNLIDAFSATLDETKEANLLLHVIDGSDEERFSRIKEVNQVLRTIGASDIPIIEVYNKIDKSTNSEARCEYGDSGQAKKVWISAKNQLGLKLLTDCIANQVNEKKIVRNIKVSVRGGKLRATLWEWGAVTSECIDDEGSWLLQIVLSEARWNIFRRNAGFSSFVSELKKRSIRSNIEYNLV